MRDSIVLLAFSLTQVLVIPVLLTLEVTGSSENLPVTMLTLLLRLLRRTSKCLLTLLRNFLTLFLCTSQSIDQTFQLLDLAWEAMERLLLVSKLDSISQFQHLPQWQILPNLKAGESKDSNSFLLNHKKKLWPTMQQS